MEADVNVAGSPHEGGSSALSAEVESLRRQESAPNSFAGACSYRQSAHTLPEHALTAQGQPHRPSNPGVPVVPLVFPIAAFAQTEPADALHRFDRMDVFGLLVAERP